MQELHFSTSPAYSPAPLSAADRLTISAGQVALLLGLSEPIFRKKRLELEDLGFPAKLPGLNKWSRAAVTRWVETNGASHLPAELDDGLRLEGDELDRRYVGAAR